MKILRSVTRRGFSVGTAGWFTVLRPNSWFPSSRLPQARRILAGRPNRAQDAAPPEVRLMTLLPRDRHPARIVVAILAAFAITSILLLWIIQPR